MPHVGGLNIDRKQLMFGYPDGDRGGRRGRITPAGGCTRGRPAGAGRWP